MQRSLKALISSMGFLLALCILQGCAGKSKAGEGFLGPTTVYSASGRELSFKEILLIVNAQSQQFHSLKADVKIEIKSDVLREIQYCNAKLIVVRPDKIRLKGYRAFVPTLFDVASNGRKYWLHFPQDKKVYTGDYYRNDIWRPSPLDIDPAQLAQAFLVEGISEDRQGQIVFVERTGENQYLVFQLEGWQTRYYLKRKIWVDGLEKRVTRQQYYVNDGNISFEVQYDKYLSDKGIALPQEIFFFRPNGNSRAVMELVSYEFNQSFNPDVFELTEIRGAETLELK